MKKPAGKNNKQAHGKVPLVQSHKTQDQLQTGDNLQRPRFDSGKLIQDTGKLEAALGKKKFLADLVGHRALLSPA